jgi:hypothetical protein
MIFGTATAPLRNVGESFEAVGQRPDFGPVERAQPAIEHGLARSRGNLLAV